MSRLVLATLEAYSQVSGVGVEARVMQASWRSLDGPGPLRLATSKLAISARVIRDQLLPGDLAILFTQLGPARVQALLPPPWRSRYAVFLLGIEVWGDLSWDRRRTLSNAAYRLSISRTTVERCRRSWPGLPECQVLPLALLDEVEGSPDERVLAQAGDDFVLIVARMASRHRYKGHDSLLRAIAEMERGPSRRTRLVVVGEGDDTERLRALADELEIADRVLFCGFVDRATLDALFRRCSVFAMPSRDEGFGLVYLEAMRAGKPCVGARCSAAEEIIVDGETGLLVDYGNVSQLADALSSLVTDPIRCRQLGGSGRTRWRQEFSLDRFQQNLFRILTELQRLEA